MRFPGQTAFSLVGLCLIAIVAIYRKLHELKKKPFFLLKIDFFLRRIRNYFKFSAAEHNKDIISQLPDDILISIIERIPVKEAIKTSVLSRKWRNLHKFVSKSELLLCGYLSGHCLGDDEPHDSHFLVDSLDRFLTIRSGNKLSTLHLVCCLDDSVTERFERCIRSLGRLGVENIYLRCNCTGAHVRSTGLPFSFDLISEMPSLKQLTLTSCYLQPGLRSSQCSNNSLKSLSLSYVTIFPGVLDCILSNCLRLRSLSLAHCKTPSKLSFRGPHLQLNYLRVDVCKDVEEIELCASNLVKFDFWNREMVDLIFEHVPKLENVYLDINGNDVVPYAFGKLARDLPHLKSLNFRTRPDIFQWSGRCMIMNTFNNVRQLFISLDNAPNIDLLLLTLFLRRLPLLQEFHLHVSTFECYQPQQKEQGTFFYSELKKVEISGFIGTEHQIEFASYILKSATSLELMRISRCYKKYVGFDHWARRSPARWSEEMHKMIERRLQGQAISKTAQVIIQHQVTV